MEEQRKRFPILITCLHILHACLSIGLIVGIVHNQLVNNTRFEKLEQKCNCNHDSDEEANRTGQNKSNTLLDSRIVGRLSSSDKHNPITKRQVPILLDANNTEHRESLKDYNAATNKTSVKNDSKETLTEKLQPTPNTTLKEKLQNTTGQIFLSNIFQEKPDLISCLEELKVIIDHYVASRENDGKPTSGCGPLQADLGTILDIFHIKDTRTMGKTRYERVVLDLWRLRNGNNIRGDTGAKGERGEKGCAGTSFAPPLFQPSPKEFVFNEGESNVLHCNATGNPAVEITWYWYRDHKIITGQRANNSRRYSIQNRDITPFGHVRAQSICQSEQPHPVKQSNLMIRELKGLDTGTYTCIAHNFMGTSNYEIHILVQEYVRYTTIPSNITVVQGENVVLNCQASGVPAPAITWYRKDGGPMPWHYNVSNGDLHIQNITKEEEGTFTCLATNVLGSKTTEATVTVNVFPQITLFHSHSKTVNESNTLVLPCRAAGYPVPDIQWSKINDSLPKDRHSYDYRLLNITSIRYKDRGKYVCTANNTVGSTQRKVIVLVQVGPKIIRRPTATEFGYLSRTKRLVFKVFSFPKANVTWKRLYWEDTMNDGRVQQENGSLVIKNVQYTDSGLYQAVARNILGEVRLTTFLVVRDIIIPPMLTAKPSREVMSFSEGTSISITCTAIGVPIPTVTWVNSDGVEMASGENSLNGSRLLNINSFTSQQRGRYTCTAQNDFGKVETYVYLLITSEIRLSGSSSNPYEGRVEIYHNGQWGTVCGKNWDITYANITCKQLGFSTATHAYKSATFGQGSGQVSRLVCHGHGSRLQDCSVRRQPTYVYSYRRRYYNQGSVSSSTCGHDRDAGVRCK